MKWFARSTAEHGVTRLEKGSFGRATEKSTPDPALDSAARYSSGPGAASDNGRFVKSGQAGSRTLLHYDCPVIAAAGCEFSALHKVQLAYFHPFMYKGAVDRKKSFCGLSLRSFIDEH